MATLVVHVLRAPAGIHPASAIALSVARDLANARGATVTALAMGDAGDRDQNVATKCGMYGADQLLFVGPEDLERLKERVAPRKVFAPNTPEGRAFLAGFGIDQTDTTSHLVLRPMNAEDLGSAKGHLLHAGTLPWHALADVIEPDYGEHFASGTPVAWLATGDDASPATFYTLQDDPDLSEGALSPLGAQVITNDALGALDGGVLLCSRGGYDGATDALASRNRAVQLWIIDGSEPPLSPSTAAAADFVFAGPADVVVSALKEPQWREALG